MKKKLVQTCVVMGNPFIVIYFVGLDCIWNIDFRFAVWFKEIIDAIKFRGHQNLGYGVVIPIQKIETFC